MAFVEYVPKLTQKYRSLGFPNYEWSVYDSIPFTPMKKPLEESCVTLISSSWIFRDDQEPFEPSGWPVNQVGIRLIPKDTDVKRLKLYYNYYDHRDAVKDINCVFPLEKLRELEKAGSIGRLAPSVVSLGMGRTYRRSLITESLVPKVVEVLREQGVEGALLVASWALDHQSIGLVARGIEESGISTVYVGSCRDMMAQVKPPRPVFVNFSMGHPCGRPHDVALQRSILKDAFRYLVGASEPGKVLDLKYEWGESFDFEGQIEAIEQMVKEEGWPLQEWTPQAAS